MMIHNGPRRPIQIGFMILFGTAVAFGLGYAVMLVWNAIMPELFGLPTITFFQTLGLAFLARMIFGGGHRGGRHRGYKSHWSSEWHDKHDESHEAAADSSDNDTDVQTS